MTRIGWLTLSPYYRFHHWLLALSHSVCEILVYRYTIQSNGFSHEIDDFAMNRRLRKDRERRLRNGSGRAARNLFAMAQDHIDNNVHGADGTVRTAPKLSKHKSKTVTFDDTIHEPHSPHSRQYSVSLSITSDEEPMDANSECFTFVPTASSSPDCVITPNTPNSAKWLFMTTICVSRSMNESLVSISVHF